MLVFIDDSGDPGFKFDRGSTRHFVIAMVIFEDDLDAERAALCIKELRRDLGWSSDVEFKFAKTSRENRRRLYEAIQPCRFIIRALTVDKSLLFSRELRENKNSFYAYFIKQTLKHHGGTIRHARVKIDGSGDRVFRKEFQTYLRRELNEVGEETMTDCRFVDSKSNVLIQMADMVAGAIHRSLITDKPDHSIYLKIIKSHVQNIWNFQ